MRVTGGEIRGRRIRSPGADDVRPTSDRVREALFARPDEWEGARVLDLYAGSGALGIEALSRGAESVVFVERSRRTLAILRRNLQELELLERSRIVQDDVPAAVVRLGREGARFECVLLDPPYDSSEVERALRAVATSGILAEPGFVVVETSRHAGPVDAPGLAPRDERRYGDTCLVWLESAAPGRAGRGGEER